MLIWEFQLFRLPRPTLHFYGYMTACLSDKAWNETCGGMKGKEYARVLDRHMLVSTCMPELVTRSCMACHAKDPLNALTEQFERTPFSHFKMFQIPFAPWNAWKLLLTTETNVLSLLPPKRAPNWFQGKWFPQTWLPAVIGLYVTHPFPHAC